MVASFRIAIVASALAISIVACDPTENTTQGPQLMVDVVPAGEDCTIQGAILKCDDVPRHLREVLEIPPDTYIAVRGTADIEALLPLVKRLEAAGFHVVIGPIELESK